MTTTELVVKLMNSDCPDDEKELEKLLLLAEKESASTSASDDSDDSDDSDESDDSGIGHDPKGVVAGLFGSDELRKLAEKDFSEKLLVDKTELLGPASQNQGVKLFFSPNVVVKRTPLARSQEKELENLKIFLGNLKGLFHENVLGFSLMVSPSYFDIIAPKVEKDLFQLLNAESKCNENDAIAGLQGVGNGIEFLGGLQLVHRDIKPENIVVCGKTWKLIDFNTVWDTRSDHKQAGIAGTIEYIHPCFLSQKYTNPTPAMDYYSFLVVIANVLSVIKYNKWLIEDSTLTDSCDLVKFLKRCNLESGENIVSQDFVGNALKKAKLPGKAVAVLKRVPVTEAETEEAAETDDDKYEDTVEKQVPEAETEEAAETDYDEYEYAVEKQEQVPEAVPVTGLLPDKNPGFALGVIGFGLLAICSISTGGIILPIVFGVLTILSLGSAVVSNRGEGSVATYDLQSKK